MAKGPQWPREACVVITDLLLDPFHLRQGQRRKRKVGGAGRGSPFHRGLYFCILEHGLSPCLSAAERGTHEKCGKKPRQLENAYCFITAGAGLEYKWGR